MTPERWKQVRALFEEALRCASSERGPFLDAACAGDEALRREVASLLESFDEAESFLEEPAVGEVADVIVNPGDKLADGQRLAHYRIVKTLGAGGMGEVYLAQDTRLGRKVALKVLPSHNAGDAAANRRLLREARAAAALDHPNICTIYETGEVDGRSYIAMQYVAGETLARRHKREPPLTLGEILAITEHIAEALAEAHSQGVVHRDIKPANVVLTPRGGVKVLDFGLAQQEAPLESGEAVTASLISAPGIVLGTMPYMSPEQVRGQPVDGRTDIWSLGITLYELLARGRPFGGPTPSDIVAAILKTEPPPLTDVPPSVWHIVARALQRERPERYQTCAELLADLQIARRECGLLSGEQLAQPLAATTRTGPGAQKNSAEPVTGHSTNSFLSGAITTAQHFLEQRKMVLLAFILPVCAVAVIAYWWRYRVPETPATLRNFDSVAVLPFVNVSRDPQSEYLADGLTESVINSLAQVSRLRVVPRNSVFRYKNKQDDLPAIGRALNVRTVLLGRIEQQGELLVIQVELIDVRADAHIWGFRETRKWADMLNIQDVIARQICDQLSLQLSVTDQERLARNRTASVEAYQLYLKGLYEYNRFSEEGFRKSIALFMQAVTRDPNYALAYTGLANCYYGLSDQYEPPHEMMPKMREAAERALALDATLAEAHTALGLVKMHYEWDWSGAEREFTTALELNPNYSYGYLYYGRYLLFTGKAAAAVAHARRALQLDPNSNLINSNLGLYYFFAGQTNEAVTQLTKMYEVPETRSYAGGYGYLGQIYETQGDWPHALAQLRQAVQNAPDARRKAMLAHAFARAGQRDEAEKLLAELREKAARSYVSPFYLAIIYDGLGDKEQVLAWLDQALQEHADSVASLNATAYFRSLRTDPRFTALLRRAGLPNAPVLR